MSWTCRICDQERKGSNEPDFVVQLGDLYIFLCDSCSEKVDDVVTEFLRKITHVSPGRR
jgi:hypothetical protein